MAHIVAGSGTKADRGAHECRLDHDVKVNDQHLSRFLVRPLHPHEADLVSLLGVVMYADRRLRRLPTEPWGRQIEVSMPSFEPSAWTSPVVASLTSCLNALSGDDWAFDFSRQREHDPLLELPFAGRATGGVVIPYSGGLDSLATLEALTQTTDAVLLMTAGTTPAVERLLHDTSSFTRCHRVCVPVGKTGTRHQEPSYRTRSFMFYTLAALAGWMADANEVVIPENGQGTFGPALVPEGREHPLLTSHPRITRLLREFLFQLVGDSVPRFHYLNAFKTKGEMLTVLPHTSALWGQTVSCGRSLGRTKKLSGAPAHCGVCSNCLLRRIALNAAELDAIRAPREDYLWSNLDAATLEESGRMGISTTSADRGYAVNSVLGHEALARRQLASASSLAVQDAAHGMGSDVESTRAAMAGLIESHRREWDGVLACLSEGSWVQALVGVLDAQD